MLVELAITDLGVIEHQSLVLDAGLTAVTGETGAGKTMIVGAIGLLLGGRADSGLVRPGADEAVVEGRFATDDPDEPELVVRRVVPASGRSRAYLNGRLSTAGELAEWGARLVDVHGQHEQQSLLGVPAQRRALDRYGSIDTSRLDRARAELTRIEAAQADLGGDPRTRARELDLLRFQIDELDRAAVADADEDERLEAEEDELADALTHLERAGEALAALTDDGGAVDAVGMALAALAGRRPFADEHDRLAALQAELAELGHALRDRAEEVVPDPERLAEVRARRQLLFELRRKYGDRLADVLAFHDEARQRLAELEAHDERSADLERRRLACLDEVAAAEAQVAAARRAAAPGLARAIEAHLRRLALPNATVEVDVAGSDGSQVTLLLAANSGAVPQPLGKVASGGELSRTMLALRLVVSLGPPTLVFDEVDAGVGGSAAHAIGAALGELGRDRQVLVVTHLPQVAAHADHQLTVEKHDDGRATSTVVRPLDGDDRVVELSRMLAGSPDSSAAREHAAELLSGAASVRGVR